MTDSASKKGEIEVLQKLRNAKYALLKLESSGVHFVTKHGDSINSMVEMLSRDIRDESRNILLSQHHSLKLLVKLLTEAANLVKEDEMGGFEGIRGLLSLAENRLGDVEGRIQRGEE